jgi:hypothetical protein
VIGGQSRYIIKKTETNYLQTCQHRHWYKSPDPGSTIVYSWSSDPMCDGCIAGGFDFSAVSNPSLNLYWESPGSTQSSTGGAGTWTLTIFADLYDWYVQKAGSISRTIQ